MSSASPTSGLVTKEPTKLIIHVTKPLNKGYRGRISEPFVFLISKISKEGSHLVISVYALCPEKWLQNAFTL